MDGLSPYNGQAVPFSIIFKKSTKAFEIKNVLTPIRIRMGYKGIFNLQAESKIDEASISEN